jgi:hypothetical protein
LTADLVYDTGEMPPPDILAPLAPKRTGLSDDPSPALYWYLSDIWNGPIYFTLNQFDAPQPEIELTLYPPEEDGVFLPGIHAIDLHDFDLVLKPDTDYEWFVFIIMDPLERSSDIAGSATIRYVPGLEPQPSYVDYAQAGYWYDAITALNDRIALEPEDKTLWSARAQLMDEVGMPLVAAFDRVE